MAAAPDLVAPVVAYRAWRVVDGDLLSPYIPCRWDGPVMHAECYPANRALLFGRGWLAEPHDPPHPDCRCGIYAYHRPGAQPYYGEFQWVEGIVAVWGPDRGPPRRPARRARARLRAGAAARRGGDRAPARGRPRRPRGARGRGRVVRRAAAPVAGSVRRRVPSGASRSS